MGDRDGDGDGDGDEEMVLGILGAWVEIGRVGVWV